ncbi:hypothetical protein [uncultured Algimonas sp.]|uniref:hypothetical protein n=1 Tax=uncultured Algimonas sp. TaxID=1547920 RepID=UPI0026016963|nr:hypothetical protein [uncultured Algimonas sp.]
MSPWTSAISLLFAATLAGLFWPADAAQTPLRPASVTKASMTPVTAAPVMARDMATQTEDVALANRCVLDGIGKADCLCVVKIMKFELPLRTYRQDVRAYVRRQAGSTIRPAVRDLVSDALFTDRCASANDFFFPGPADR